MLFWLLLQAATAVSNGTISGKVTSAQTGAPIVRAQIWAEPDANSGELKRASTDNDGNYQMSGVEPGTYTIRCLKASYIPTVYKADRLGRTETVKLGAEQTVKDVDCSMSLGASISGSVTNEDGEPLSGVGIGLMVKRYPHGKPQLESRSGASTDDHGNYRIYDLPAGRYYVVAGGRNYGPIAMPYDAVIYPNASRLSDAQAVPLAAGSEVTGINLVMRLGKVYSVSGKAMDLRSGRPLSNQALDLAPEDPVLGAQVYAWIRPDGSFRFTRVPPGAYHLSFANMAPDIRREPLPQIGKQVEVSGNITGLNVSIGPGATIRGKLRAEGADLPERLRVHLVERTRAGPSYYFDYSEVKTDGSFELKNVQPGSYELDVEHSYPKKFFLSQINLNDHDVTGAGINIPEGGGTLEVSALMDFRGGEISGRVTDSDDKPLRGMLVALVNADPKKRTLCCDWQPAVSDSTGAFKILSITPGDYFLLPWPGDEAGPVLDPEVFEQVKKHAVSVTIERSGVLTQDLKATPELRALAEAFAQ